MGNMTEAGRYFSMNPAERAALERLLGYAVGHSESSQAIADLLLAWWNADTCGCFDPRSLWQCEDRIVDDAVTVFGLMAHCRWYPDQALYDDSFARLVALWRPEL